jgi:para-aminobenzoate synthetase component 1
MLMMENKPLYKEIPYQDPVEHFAPFAKEHGAVFLDSAKQSAELGRYSYLAVDPFWILRVKDQIIQFNNDQHKGNPWDFLQAQLCALSAERVEGLPPFQGGVAGYFSYDLGRHLEKLPDTTINDQDFPDLILGFYDLIISYDHELKKAWIISTGLPEKNATNRKIKAEQRLEEWEQRLKNSPKLQPITEIICTKESIVSNSNRKDYESSVQKVIDYILAGDIFEANISQRFSSTLPDQLNSFELYRRLRKKNAAPFAGYLNFSDVVIASASPERFLQLSDRDVETRPIKGTSARYSDPVADQASAQALLDSEKDWAENVMIVDLMRNDLSRVCEDHSVKVPQLCGLESFATVHHLVSVVRGKLASEHDAVDLLRATFPGGSITGAPKVRAMEIIDEIESHRRGPYCGSLGFIGFNGDMDSSITIRTYAIKNNQLSFHVGGAVVADSSPAEEYQETLDKAAAMIAALITGP